MKHQRLCAICHKRPVYGQRQIVCAHCLFEKHATELGLTFEHEYRFHSKRLWRSDFRILNRLRNGQEVLIEIDGGVYTQGRHTRGKGAENDMRKLNAAAAMGFMTLRFSSNMVNRGEARSFLAEHLGQR